VLARHLKPSLEQRHPLLGGGQGQVPALDPLEVGAQLGLEPAPQPVGLDHQRDFPGIATLLADGSPVAPPLPPRDLARFQQQRRHAPAREVVGGGAADDPAADDHDLGSTRHGSSDQAKWRATSPAPASISRPDEVSAYVPPMMTPSPSSTSSTQAWSTKT